MKKKRSILKASPMTGFTLMEIVLAIAITGFIMVAIYSTLFITIKARDQIEKESLKCKVGPSILDLIERDVSGVWCMNIHKNDVFFGEHRSINGEPADYFHMITATDSTTVVIDDDEPIRSDLCEVSYRLRSNPDNPDWLELWRRQDFHVDDRMAEEGQYELVYSRINSFQVFYYKNLYEGAERFDEWDAKVRNRLPMAMEIFMTLEVDPRLAGYDLDEMERPLQEFNRVIFFPQGSELTMAVRPVIPVPVVPEEEPPTGGGGPDDGEGTRSNTPPPDQGKGPDDGLDLPDVGDGFNPGGDSLDDLPEPPMKPPPTPGGDIDLEELLKLLWGKGKK